MASQAVPLGPFNGGLFNSAGSGEFIGDEDVFELVNMEVDLDQSLVNRPAISKFNWTGSTATRTVVLGTYITDAGVSYLVIGRSGQLGLLNTGTGVVDVWNGAVGGAINNPSVTQYRNRLFVIGDANDPATAGGYFLNTTWTAVNTMPRGGCLFVFKNRLWTVSGIAATSNISRLQYSKAGTPTIFGTDWDAANDFWLIDESTGHKLVFALPLANDILLFKEHSSHRFTYDSDPIRAVVTKVSGTIGCPDANCATTYDNNTVYVLHGSDVYEVYNFQFQRISSKVALNQVVDADLNAADTYGLTAYRDRLIVRYFSSVYCYNLKTASWSEWQSARKFSYLVVMQTAATGLDIAFGGSGSASHLGEIYYIRDSRVFNVGIVGGEQFDCWVTTKTYEYEQPESFKRLWQWGISIATLGSTKAEVVLPNAGHDKTWGEDEAFTWGDLAGEPWGTADAIISTSNIPPDRGGYARKYYKIWAACRFRRVFYRITTSALPNTVADACVRIYNLTTFIRASERAKEKVS